MLDLMNEKEIQALTHPALPAFLDHPAVQALKAKMDVILQDPKVLAAFQKISETPNIKNFYLLIGITFIVTLGIRFMITLKIKSLPLKIVAGVLTLPAFPTASYFIAEWFFGESFLVITGQLKNLF